MTHTPDATAAGNDDTFDPQQAAALLDQTRQQAHRRLAPSPPWLLATRGVMVLAALGAIWLSVRGQHPYRGPTSADIPVLIAFIVLNFVATVTVRQRAMTGVRGKSRFSPAEIAILTAAWVATAVLMAALSAAGVRYGWYPTTVLIIPGLTWAAVSARRASWSSCAVGLAMTVTGIAGLFAGPAGAWLVAGVGLCVTLLGKAAVTIAARQHA
ncbi:MAG TPA: hypothetical protein VGM53_20385 [Streptosporangiaceae bacterium]|jgi:hypothetical protein